MTKNQPRITVENNDDQVKVRIQLESNEKPHKSISKQQLMVSNSKTIDIMSKGEMGLINTPANDNFCEKKR